MSCRLQLFLCHLVILWSLKQKPKLEFFLNKDENELAENYNTFAIYRPVRMKTKLVGTPRVVAIESSTSRCTSAGLDRPAGTIIPHFHLIFSKVAFHSRILLLILHIFVNWSQRTYRYKFSFGKYIINLVVKLPTCDDKNARLYSLRDEAV